MAELAKNWFLALPPSGKGPGVLVLHAWWGLNDFIRAFCKRLAAEGYVVLAPDLFAGKTAQTPDAAEQLVTQADEAQNVGPLVLSALGSLKSLSAVNGKGLAVIGLSFGGYWALWLAGQDPDTVRAVNIFYATGRFNFQQSKAAFLCHFADDDPFESDTNINELRKELQDAQRPAAFHTYPGTGHWFFENDRPDAYDPQAAALAWERTLAFLREQTGPAAQ